MIETGNLFIDILRLIVFIPFAYWFIKDERKEIKEKEERDLKIKKTNNK